MHINLKRFVSFLSPMVFCLLSVLFFAREELMAEEICKPDELVQRTYTSCLPEITSIEILSLDGAVGDAMEGEAWFPLPPYKDSAKILARKEIEGSEAQEIATLWRQLTPGDQYVTCHQPVYGLRFYNVSANRPDLGKQLLFETSVCWKCANFYAPTIYPAGDSQWVYFDAQSDAAKALLKKLRSLLPARTLED